MEIDDKIFDDELRLLQTLRTSKDKNGNPIIKKIYSKDEKGRLVDTHLVEINPNIEPAHLISLINNYPKMFNPSNFCMNITTTIFAYNAYVSNKEREYNIFIKEATTLMSKDTGKNLYKKAKDNGKALIFPDFEYFFGEFTYSVNTDNIDKSDKEAYTNNFINVVHQCMTRNDLQILKVNTK